MLRCSLRIPTIRASCSISSMAMTGSRTKGAFAASAPKTASRQSERQKRWFLPLAMLSLKSLKNIASETLGKAAFDFATFFAAAKSGRWCNLQHQSNGLQAALGGGAASCDIVVRSTSCCRRGREWWIGGTTMPTPNLPAIRACRPAWNKGRIVGQKRPLMLKHV